MGVVFIIIIDQLLSDIKKIIIAFHT